MKTLLRRLLLAAVALAAPGSAAATEALHVVTTTPDLAALTREVGGDAVDAVALVKGPQDPHFVEPRPSFIRQLHDADLFVQQGLELEVGWVPVLLQSARNAAILPGGPGFVDASVAIVPLEVPTTAIDRSMGDVHPYGNPHYLADPINGLRVARLLRDRLQALRPADAERFAAGYRDFESRLLARLVGPELAKSADPDALVAAVEQDRLDAFAASHGGAPLRGWLGAMAPYRGTEVVQDHRIWPYFTRRFGLVPVAELEPKPGIAPTTAHLAEVIERVRADAVPLLLATPYFDPRHAMRVADKTGAKVVVLAHQVGALEGTDDYLQTVDRNVGRVADAL